MLCRGIAGARVSSLLLPSGILGRTCKAAFGFETRYSIGRGVAGSRSSGRNSFTKLSRREAAVSSLKAHLRDYSINSKAMDSSMEAPRAQREEHQLEDMFGVPRSDDFYWLRDDKRQNPEVLAYLQAENDYTDKVMAPIKGLQENLYKEMRGKIKEDDASVPLRHGPYWYYRRTEEGKQYKVHCRRAVPQGEGPGALDEVMPAGSDAPPEEVLLDENEMAAQHKFYKVAAFEVSPNHKLVAVGQDTQGGERYSVRVLDLATGRQLGAAVENAAEELAWASDNQTLFYITKDHVERPYKVWRHVIGREQSEDVCVVHEEDESFYLSISRSRSEGIVAVHSASSITSDVKFIPADCPEADFRPATTRHQGVDTSVAHRGDHFFVTRRSDELFNSELLVCSVASPEAATTLLPHRPTVKLEHVQVFERHLAVFEREAGLQAIIVYELPPLGQDVPALGRGTRISFAEEVYALEPEESQFKSALLRFGFTSLKTPYSVFDYDMASHQRALKKIQPVLGGFDAGHYETARRWAAASDGTHVPISIVYRKDCAKLDGSDPCHLYGYGSYEISIDPYFDSSRLALLDHGVVFAIAHVRGGGEMGRPWYERGKFLEKKNTFTDFIACAQYLLDNQWAAPSRLSIEGRSAGGLLIGAVLNMRPELFAAAILGVPFVDVVTTMLDVSIPLTTKEWEEWGNPREEEYFHYMLSYSPVDNVAAKAYPNILVTAGLHDSRVGYWEPAKWVAKLRASKTDENKLLFKCDLGAGHFSKSGRFDKLNERAMEYAFLLTCLGTASPPGETAAL